MSSNDKRQIPIYAFQSIRWSRTTLATAIAVQLWTGTGTCLHADTGPKVGDKASVNATAFVDPKALELLEHVKQRLRTIQTLSAVCTHTLQHHKGLSRARTTWIVRTVRLRLMRPNLSCVDTAFLYKRASENLWHKTPHYRTDASDGHKEWTVSYAGREFWIGKAAANGHNLILRDIAPLDGFFDPEDFVLTKVHLLWQEGLLVKLALGAPIRENGVAYRLVRLVYRRVGSQVIETEDYCIGADLLIHRIHTSTSAGDTESEVVLSPIHVDRAMAKSSFAYSPPAGFQHRNSEEPMTALLPNGATAPGFTVQDAQGNPVRLADLRGKWVILDFWATWCGPCVHSFPGTNALATQYKDKNVVALAISVGDTPKVFEAWLSRHKDYDALRFAIDPAGIEGKGIDKRYKVGALPTQYLIDPTGKISASFVGYDNNSEKRLADALKSAVSPLSANAPSALQSQTPPP